MKKVLIRTGLGVGAAVAALGLAVSAASADDGVIDNPPPPSTREAEAAVDGVAQELDDEDAEVGYIAGYIYGPGGRLLTEQERSNLQVVSHEPGVGSYWQVDEDGLLIVQTHTNGEVMITVADTTSHYFFELRRVQAENGWIVGMDDIELRESAYVTGRLLHTDGTPFTDVDPYRMLVTASYDSRSSMTKYANSDGTFTLPGITTGDVTLRVHDQLGEYKDATISNVHAIAGQITTNQNLTMAMKGVIRGRVVGKDGQPLTQAEYSKLWLDAKDTGGRTAIRHGDVDAQGNYTVTGLTGNVDLYISGSGLIDTTVARNVRVEDEATTQGPDLVIRSRGSVQGTLRATDGSPMSGYLHAKVNIGALPGTGGFRTSTSIRADGSYSFDDVPAGDYLITVDGDAALLKPTDSIRVHVDHEMQTTAPPITVVPRPGAFGMMRGPDGKILTNSSRFFSVVRDSAGNAVGNLGFTTTGQFNWTIDKPGTYTVSVTDSSGEFAETKAELRLVDGTRTGGQDISMLAAGRIQAMITGVDGPLPYFATFTARDQNGKYFSQTRGPNGFFTVGGLSTGTYTILVSKEYGGRLAQIDNIKVVRGEVTVLPTIRVGAQKFAPMAPSFVKAQTGAGSAVLTWENSTDTGFAPLTGHVIEQSTDGGNSWTRASAQFTSLTSATVTGLTGEQAYVFRVASVNEVGSSAFSTASAAVTPTAAPAVLPDPVPPVPAPVEPPEAAANPPLSITGKRKITVRRGHKSKLSATVTTNIPLSSVRVREKHAKEVRAHLEHGRWVITVKPKRGTHKYVWTAVDASGQTRSFTMVVVA